MSDKKEKRSPSFLFVFTIVVAVWLLGGWLLSASASDAAVLLPALQTFQSPVGNPALTLAKTVDNDTPSVGDEIEYTLSYANMDLGSQAFNVKLYDFLPSSLEYISASPSPAYNAGGMLMFTAPSVGPGTESTDITIRARVRGGYESLRNQALLTADGVDSAHTSLLTQVNVLLDKLALAKNGYAAVLRGGQFAYTLRVENIHTEAVDDVSLVDVLPPDLTFVDAYPAPSSVTLPIVRWDIGTLDPAQVWVATITATAPSAIGVLTNTAIADGFQSVMTQTLFSTQVVSEAAILHLDKLASLDQAVINDEIVYTLHYRNVGNQTANGIILTDTFPSNINVTASDPAPFDINATRGIWQLGSLAAGAEGEVVITATVTGLSGGYLYNQADITGSNSFPSHADISTPVSQFWLFLPMLMRGYVAP